MYSTFLFFFFKSCVFRSPASRFGLPTCLPLLQHPICSSGFPVLDFIRVSLCSNVQSMFPASRFWTSSVPHSALTSNSRFRLPGFGLPPCLTPLQRPIHASSFPVLDFFLASLCFNVQSTPPASRFWTSSLPHSASTSNYHFLIPTVSLIASTSPP